MARVKNRSEAIASLQRYYHCSVEMKYRFAEIWGGPLPTDPHTLYANKQILQGVYGYMYMSLWLGFLNSTIEGWKIIGISDQKIDNLLKKDFVKNINIFRHSVFHYQQNYWAKMAEKHLVTKGLLQWVYELDSELERWFKDNKPS